MSTVFLICGNTGAGKTTYSIALAEKQHAIRFSTDSWMQTLYGDDYNNKLNDFLIVS